MRPFVTRRFGQVFRIGFRFHGRVVLLQLLLAFGDLRGAADRERVVLSERRYDPAKTMAPREPSSFPILVTGRHGRGR